MISALYQNRIPASFLPKTSPSAKKTFLSEKGWRGEAVTEGVRPPKRPPSAKKTSLFEGRFPTSPPAAEFDDGKRRRLARRSRDGRSSSPNGRSPHAHQLRCLSRFLHRRPARQLHQSRRGAAVQPAQPYPNHPQSGIGARLYALCAQQPRRGAHAGGRKAVCARCRRL